MFNGQHSFRWVNRHLGVEDTRLADECPSDGIGLLSRGQTMYHKPVLMRHLNGVVNR